MFFTALRLCERTRGGTSCGTSRTNENEQIRESERSQRTSAILKMLLQNRTLAMQKAHVLPQWMDEDVAWVSAARSGTWTS